MYSALHSGSVGARTPPCATYVWHIGWLAAYSPAGADVTAKVPSRIVELRTIPGYLDTGVADVRMSPFLKKDDVRENVL